MKKVIICIFLCFAFVNIKAQDIESDSFDGGLHHVVAEWQEVEDKSDKRDFFVRLQGFKDQNNVISYYLDFQLYSYAEFGISKGSKLLVKTSDEETITLIEEYEPGLYYQLEDNIFVISKHYYMTVGYIVSQEILSKLEKGIIKLRFEVSNEKFEKVYTKDKIGKYLKKAEANIDAALDKQNSFEEGF